MLVSAISLRYLAFASAAFFCAGDIFFATAAMSALNSGGGSGKCSFTYISGDKIKASGSIATGTCFNTKFFRSFNGYFLSVFSIFKISGLSLCRMTKL
jgi:hypothetical protein